MLLLARLELSEVGDAFTARSLFLRSQYAVCYMLHRKKGNSKGTILYYNYYTIIKNVPFIIQFSDYMDIKNSFLLGKLSYFFFCACETATAS